MKDQIDNLFQQKLTRKEFLQYIGSGLLVIFGVSNLLKALQAPIKKQPVSGMGYGSSAYGGTPKK